MEGQRIEAQVATDVIVYTYTEDELCRLANEVKELLISTLHVEGELPGDPEQLSATYAIVRFKGTMMGRLWNKFRGIEADDDALRWTVVKSTDWKNEAAADKG